ncbi:MAG: hypothetical protein NTV32_02055 [Gammaproteobacteria bacterium]|nr:hypothetical protein [Gammaproteobacteria bacterium]
MQAATESAQKLKMDQIIKAFDNAIGSPQDLQVAQIVARLNKAIASANVEIHGLVELHRDQKALSALSEGAVSLKADSQIVNELKNTNLSSRSALAFSLHPAPSAEATSTAPAA